MLNRFEFQYIQPLANLDQISQDLQFKQGIYMLFYLDENGVLHFYIGSSVNMGNRIREHVLDARPGESNYHVHNSMRLHGVNKFSVGILSFLPDVSIKVLQAAEIDFIIKFKPSLNMKNGSNGFATNSKPVLVTNKQTGATQEFPSLRSCARHFKVSQSSLQDTIKFHYTLRGIYSVRFK